MLYFTGAKALCADIHLLDSAGNLDRYSLNIGVPDTIGSSMRMADVISEMNAFSTDFAFCHVNTS